MAKIDDSVKKKVPELRFKGFTDEWEERKFADFIDVKSGKDYKHLNSGSIPVYGTGGYMLSVDRALSDTDAIGIGRKGTIDKPYLLKAPFWTVDTLFYAVPKQNIDLQFSLSIFKKINWKKFDESTGVPSLSKTVINSVSVSVPNFEEQQKIGSFFKQLDDTIALHQHKLDLLKEQKKGFLQKMFPKNGEKVPELRFEGFTDDWEERKLSEIGKIVTGNTPNTSNKDYYNGDFLFVSPADIQENRYVNKTTTTLTELGFKTGRLVPKGATLFVSIGSTIGKTGQSICDVITNQQINSVISFSDYDDDFIYTSILNSSTKIKQLAATQAVPIINKNEFGKSIIKIPSLEEQQKIGAFFKQLDDIIALHQRKLDLLKEQKKGFLQKMFV
ncbi:MULTISPECIES: restriction endonuclease subunit S [Enterococcus]|uniref:restriction endonuclease subunit S n=1 Tax=Enterococcus TaxID=1350 RepID=UPI002EB9BEE6|nr:restriction endonuclease subunit S [Enterococcus faecium]